MDHQSKNHIVDTEYKKIENPTNNNNTSDESAD
jgi:hypothetical protein